MVHLCAGDLCDSELVLAQQNTQHGRKDRGELWGTDQLHLRACSTGERCELKRGGEEKGEEKREEERSCAERWL